MPSQVISAFSPLHVEFHDFFSFTCIDGSTSGAGRAEGKSGEFELGGRGFGAFGDQLHRELTHFLALLFFQHFKAIGECTNRRNDVVADAAGKQRREIERRKCW